MEQYTSEQALNGIFGILQNLVQQSQERSEEKKPNEVSNLVKDLLNGTAAAAAAGTSIGEEVEQLAKGISAIKEAGITDADATMVVSMISGLGRALQDL